MVFLYTDGSIAKGLTKNKFLGLKGICETRKKAFVRMWEML